MRLVLALALLAPLLAFAQTPTVVALPPQFSGTHGSYDGSVFAGKWEVQTSTPSQSRFFPAVLADGVARRLHLPPEYTDGPYPHIHGDAITSGDGSVIAAAVYGQWPPYPDHGVGLWRGPDAQVDILFPTRQTRPAPIALSYDGSVLLARGDDGLYFWEDGVVTQLQTPAGAESAQGLALSEDGSTAYGWALVSGAYALYRWDRQGVPTLVEALEPSVSVNSASGDGTAVFGQIRDASGGLHPIRIQDGTRTAVEGLRFDIGTGEPNHVSHDGKVVIAVLEDGVAAGTAHQRGIWVDGAGTLELQEYFQENHGIAPLCSQSPTVWRTAALSGSARVFVLHCSHPTGERSTFRFSLPAVADWVDAADGAFDDPERWAPSLVPDSLTVTRFAAVQGLTSYTVAFGEAHTLATLTVSAPAAQPISTPVVFDLDGYDLTLSPTSPGLDALLVADQSDGDLTLSGGSLHATAGVTLGRAGSARGRLSLLNDHSLRVDGPLVVGDGGTGSDETPSTLSVDSGTVTAHAGVDVGLQSESAGYILLSPGTFFQVPSASVSTVGFAGSGRVIADGAFLSHTGPLTLGRLSGARGELSLSALPGSPGPSTALVTDSLIVGLEGEGVLFVDAGSGLTSGPAVLGAQRGGLGSALLSGAGTEWDIAGDLLNGATGRGSGLVEVRDGASLCISGLGVTGEGGRLVTDGTARIGFSDCTSFRSPHRDRAQKGGGSVSMGGLVVEAGGEVEAGAIEIGPNGTVGGTGALVAPLVNGGILAPGGNGALGTLTLASPLTLASGGAVSIEVGVETADVLALAEPVALGGVLRLSAAPGETPQIGSRFDVLTSPEVTGSFSRVEAPEGLDVEVTPTAVAVYVTGAVGTEAPEAPSLALNAAPNPTRGPLAVQFTLPEAHAVRLTLHDLLGREVAVLADGPHAAGRHRIEAALSPLAPGVYALSLTSPEGVATQRVTLLR